MKDNKLLIIAAKHSSNQGDIKNKKIADYASKLNKKYKCNEYVEVRDAVVLALVILGQAQEKVGNVKTTKNGRNSLNELLNEIEKAFKEEIA